MKVQNDVAVCLDKGQITALTLLDLSVANSDTIDHTTPTGRLAIWYGVSGVALVFF